MRRGRGLRLIGRALRLPAVLDRRGTRWALQMLSPAPVVILVHRGRRSGRLYRTPVEVLATGPDPDSVVVSPMWGRRSDWYRNVLAGGLVELRVDGEPRQVEWRELDLEEKRAGVAEYRRRYPRYGRLVLRMLVALHELDGDPAEAVAKSLPVLVLQETRA